MNARCAPAPRRSRKSLVLGGIALLGAACADGVRPVRSTSPPIAAPSATASARPALSASAQGAAPPRCALELAPLLPVAFSPDSQTLLVVAEGELEVWDLRGQKPARRLGVPVFDRPSPHVAWSRDGATLVTLPHGLSPRPLQVFDTATWAAREVATIIFGDSVAISDDGRRGAAMGQAGELTTFELPSGKLLKQEGDRWGHAIARVELSADGSIVFVTAGESLSISRTSDLRVVARFTAVRAADHAPPLSPRRDTLAIVAEEWSGLVSARTGARLRSFAPVDFDAPTLLNGEALWSPTGAHFVATDAWQALQLWDTASGKRVAKIAAFGSRPTFSPDGRYLTSEGGQGESVTIWDGRTGSRIYEIPKTRGVLRWLSDREVLLHGHAIEIHDVSTQRRVRTIETRETQAQDEAPRAELSRDGRLLAVERGSGVRVVRLSDGATVDLGAVVVGGVRRPLVRRAGGAYDGPEEAAYCFFGSEALRDVRLVRGLLAELSAR